MIASRNLRAAWLSAIAIVGWFALTLQLYLMLAMNANGGKPAIWAVAGFFSFFTIWTNVVVALWATTLLAWPSSRLGRFVSQPSTQAAVGSYIVFVCLAYNLLLRHLWNPQGAAMLADELLHDVVPLLYLAYWLAFSVRQGLHVRQIFAWLLYPLAYVTYAFVRGALVHQYAYHFIDVSALGFPTVVRNVIGLLAAFIVLGLIFVGLSSAAILPPRSSE